MTVFWPGFEQDRSDGVSIILHVAVLRILLHETRKYDLVTWNSSQPEIHSDTKFVTNSTVLLSPIEGKTPERAKDISFFPNDFAILHGYIMGSINQELKVTLPLLVQSPHIQFHCNKQHNHLQYHNKNISNNGS